MSIYHTAKNSQPPLFMLSQPQPKQNRQTRASQTEKSLKHTLTDNGEGALPFPSFPIAVASNKKHTVTVTLRDGNTNALLINGICFCFHDE